MYFDTRYISVIILDSLDLPLLSFTSKEKASTESESTEPFTLALGADLIPFENVLDANQPCLDSLFFEQYMDFNSLFGDLENCPLFPTDICPPDVVSATSEVTDASSELASLQTAELPSPDEVLSFLDSAASVSDTGEMLVPQLGSLPLHIDISDEEITVIQTSETLSPASPGSLPLSPASSESASDSDQDHMKFDQAVDFTELFEAIDAPILSTCSSTEIEVPSVTEVLVQPKAGTLKRKCEPSWPSLPAKISKKADSSVCDSDSSESIPSPVASSDKCSERRRKNNIASKGARAARKERERNLFLQEEELERSNAELRAQVEMLTKQAVLLRKIVVEKLSKGTCM